MSPRRKRNTIKVIIYGIFFMVAGLLYVLMEQGIMADAPVYPSTGAPYNFHYTLPTTPLFSGIFGMVLGIIEVSMLQPLLKGRSFHLKLFIKSGIYVAFVILMIFILSLSLNSLATRRSIFHPEIFNVGVRFFLDFAFWSIIIYIIAVMIVTQFFIEVIDSLGKIMLLNFVTGKYHTPQVERRIFMFLDLKNSTPMAESLGHIRYFELLNTFFADVSDVILDCWGEIYQYVGDEIVVAWPWERGLLNANCIDCFYRIQEKINSRHAYYESQFGLIPEFRASIHGGEVSIGEIGTFKKDILFTGDILNAASRILSMCKEFETTLLVSASVVDDLGDVSSTYSITSAGECTLRGKSEKIELYRVMEKEHYVL
jgi:adenylate cyclase